MIPFTFGPEFQDNVLTLMLNDLAFTDKCLNFIEEDHLYSDSHKWMFKQIKTKYDTENTVPCMVDIEDNLKKADKSKRRLYKAFAHKIIEARPKSSEFIKTKLTEFAKKSAFIDLFQYGQTLYNEGSTQDAYDYVLESINHLHNISFKNDQIISIQNFEDERRRSVMQRNLEVDRIPTLIPSLDQILMGGLSKFDGEFGLILAAPKVGKSTALIHMGFACLTSLKGRVAHFVLEGATEQTITRYQSRLSGIPAKMITKNNLSEYEESKLEMIGKRFMDRLDIIPFNQHWDYTTGDIEGKLVELEREGKSPDLVVIDYADLLKGRKSFTDVRHEQTSVFRDIKNIGMRMRKAIWSACLAGETKIHTLHGHIQIKDLVGKKGIPVYAYNHEEGKVEVQTISEIFQTDTFAEVWEVEFDNGEKVRMTPNHRLMLRSGEYKELRECVVGESIMPMRIYQQKSGSSDRREPFVNINLNRSIEKNKDLSRYHERIRESHLVAEWKYDERNDLHVHHIDGDWNNNHPDNIKLMTNSEHRTFHLSKKNWMKTEDGKQWWSKNNPQLKKSIRVRTSKTVSNIWKERKRLGVEIRKKPDYMSDEQIINKAKQLSCIDRKSLKEAGLWDRVSKRLGGVFGLKELLANNHKIVSIRECKVNVPVFNLTVEPSHNYALSAGVFVKNSQSQRPKDGPNKETVLRSMSISEAYEKVRIADFVGTLNQTPFEKDAGILRFLADIYRNNTSDVMIRLFCDFERMVFSSKKLTDILPHEIYHAAPWKIKR